MLPLDKLGQGTWESFLLPLHIDLQLSRRKKKFNKSIKFILKPRMKLTVIPKSKCQDLLLMTSFKLLTIEPGRGFEDPFII